MNALRAVSVGMSLAKIGLAVCLLAAWMQTPDTTQDAMSGGAFFGFCLGFVCGSLLMRGLIDVFKITTKAQP